MARQRFDDTHLKDVEKAVHEQITRPEIAARVHSGMRIAIGAGSRGIANIGITVRATVQALREFGAKPFVFPAMGSHGGATAEGQQAVLAGYDITEESVGAPIRATMDTILIGSAKETAFLQRNAHKSKQLAEGMLASGMPEPGNGMKVTQTQYRESCEAIAAIVKCGFFDVEFRPEV